MSESGRTGDVGVVTTIMHDTADLDGALAFWTTLLGLEVVHREGAFAYLDRLSGDGPRLAFQQVPETLEGKNRLHLDIRVPDRGAFARRVVELGGGVVDEHQEGDFPSWTVCSDPEGHRFCIYEGHE